jgi:hypothetical protein
LPQCRKSKCDHIAATCESGEFADNLFIGSGRTSFVRWSINREIVPNRFLQQGRPGTIDTFTALRGTWRVIHERRQVVTPDFLL